MCPLPEHTCETIPFMQVSFWFPFIISPMAVGYCTVDFIGQTDQHPRRWEWHTGWGCPDNKTWKGTTFWLWKLYDLGPNQSWWQVLLGFFASLCLLQVLVTGVILLACQDHMHMGDSCWYLSALHQTQATRKRYLLYSTNKGAAFGSTRFQMISCQARQSSAYL